ncbi:MAG: ABC transporter permease [Bacteroidales bacterium]|nr:ABC transporter permease [Bacteroidales bacterium]
MNFSNLFKIAYQAILRNKTRSLLTMLGVIIGISSVIAMVSLGQSSSQNINEQISTMGTNLIMVMRANQNRGGVNMGNSNSQSLSVKDAEAIKQKCPSVDMVSPMVSAGGQMVRGSNNWPGSMQGGGTDLIRIRKYDIEKGTNFTDNDIKEFKKVCLIGKTVASNLFPDGVDPVGQEIRFGKTPFKIIGVLSEKGQNQMGQDQDDIVIAPYSTVMKRLLATQYIHMIYASAISEEACNTAVDEITAALRITHKIKDGDENDFDVRTQAELLSMLNSVTGFLTILLAAIASISLIVGGIGIMNIMYVTVTERTKEIGLRTAIGARSRDIMYQFLLESSMLSLVGGLIGIVFGLFLSYAISLALGWPFIVSISAIITSFIVCAATGIFFGWYPAKKAANLDPINALRYE